MRRKPLILAGALALMSLPVLGAKSYDITLSSPAKAGALQLPAGEYSVKLEGANAVFTNEEGEKLSAPVKVVTENKKFRYTAVETTRTNGTDQVTGIELGGSATLLEFGD